MNGVQRRASVAVAVASTAVFAIASVEKQATLTVQPRDWAGRVTYPAALPDTNIDVSTVQGTQSPYWIALPDGLDSFPDGWTARYRFGYTATRIWNRTAGINGLWSYINNPPTFLTPVVWLSPAFFPGNAYYDAQDVNVSPERPTHPDYPRYCTRADDGGILCGP